MEDISEPTFQFFEMIAMCLQSVYTNENGARLDTWPWKRCWFDNESENA